MRVFEDYAAGNVEQEPAITDRMLQAIVQALDGNVKKGFIWNAKTFGDRGPNSQESRVGADFLGVVSAALPEFAVTKGFLAQAKRLERGEVLRAADLATLKAQCRAMLELTPDSFVFLYAHSGIVIVPAIAVVAYQHGNLHELHQRSITTFLLDHFSCFVGDASLGAADEAAIRRAMAAAGARAALAIQVAGVPQGVTGEGTESSKRE